jgi:hypothetical protein
MFPLSGSSRNSILGALGLGAVALLLFFFSPSSPFQAAGVLPQSPLPVLSGGEEVSLSRCPTEKCLTVYVAPWCGYCRASTGAVKALKEYLRERNVSTRIVVGLDKEANLRDYAREFGPETVLDAGGAVAVQGGVPHFYISDRSGRVLRELAGVPQDAITDVAQLAAYFGLP